VSVPDVFSGSLADPAVAGAVAAGGVGVVLAILAHLRLFRLRRSYSLLQGDAQHSSFIVAVARHTAEMERLRREVATLRAGVRDGRVAVDESLRRVALMRYDASGVTSGMLSWSLALLDEEGDGVVLTSLVSVGETRTYAKSVVAGRSDEGLSREEQRVVRAALGARTASPAVSPAPAAAPAT
jgi:hypothetical protein